MFLVKVMAWELTCMSQRNLSFGALKMDKTVTCELFYDEGSTWQHLRQISACESPDSTICTTWWNSSVEKPVHGKETWKKQTWKSQCIMTKQAISLFICVSVWALYIYINYGKGQWTGKAKQWRMEEMVTTPCYAVTFICEGLTLQTPTVVFSVALLLLLSFPIKLYV